MMIDKDKLFSELDAMGETSVREKLALRVFHKDKISLIQEWLRQQAQPKDKMWIYHELDLPKGKIILKAEATNLYKKGWVASPKEFGKGIRSKWYRLIIFIRYSKENSMVFIKNNRDALIVRIIGGIVLLFIAYFINKYILSTSNQTQSQQVLQSQPTTTKMTVRPK